MDRSTVHYFPLLTTAISIAFGFVLFRAAAVRRSGPHLNWWAWGVLFYGLGTAIESWITLFGNTPELTKAWYVFGALLGGYPLAQGSIWLLMPPEKARRLTGITLPIVIAAAIVVAFSPVHLDLLEAHRPTGSVLAWTWVRFVTPFVNLYAAIFLIGGAIVSGVRYAKAKLHPERAWGNAFIAFGALLPGIGGSMAKAGMVEALYVGECIGLALIWIGYGIIVRRREAPASAGSSAARLDSGPASAWGRTPSP